MLEALPDYRGGKLPGRGKVDEGIGRGRGGGGGERKEEGVSGLLAGEPRETDAAEGEVTRKAASVVQSTKAGRLSHNSY